MDERQDERLDDTELDGVIQQVLSDMTSPPAPAMDEMWAHIEREHFGPAGVLRWRSHRSTARWATMLAPIAAALIVGVAVGRYSMRGYSTGQYSAAQERVVVTPSSSRRAATQVRSLARDSAGLRTAEPAAPSYVSTPASSRAAMPVRIDSHNSDEAYQDEMGRYLVHTAALLTALPANGQGAESDTDVANRASALLTQTHLLLDSQVGSDPALHRLLEDLELVLAQVARLHPARGTTDLQLIHQALQQRDVLPRLHEAAVEAASTD